MNPFRRKAPEPEPVTGPPVRDPLDLLGAEYHALPVGCFVYNLHQADGTIFYTGQSENLISRLRDHKYKYGARFHHYSTIACRDAHQMDLYELLLIDWYQPEENKAGTAEVESLRRRVHRSGSSRNLDLSSLRRAGNG